MAKANDYSPFSYNPDKKRDGRVSRQYLKLRAESMHCDICGCPPEWNGKPLKLTVDHYNGASFDSRFANLRLLCGNCHLQQPTTGGRNRGRVEARYDTCYIVRGKKKGTRTLVVLPEGSVKLQELRRKGLAPPLGVTVQGSAGVNFIPAGDRDPESRKPNPRLHPKKSPAGEGGAKVSVGAQADKV